MNIPALVIDINTIRVVQGFLRWLGETQPKDSFTLAELQELFRLWLRTID